MRLYKDTYYLEQDLEKVFDYYSKKAFLLRYFKPREIARIWVESDGPDPYVKMGETIVLILEGQNPREVKIVIEPQEISPYSRLAFIIYSEMDNPPTQYSEDSMELLMGKGMWYEMNFFPEGNRVRVEESCDLLQGGILAKGFMYLVTLNQSFRRKSTQQKIIQEINRM